jgi:hypothetical protein
MNPESLRRSLKHGGGAVLTDKYPYIWQPDGGTRCARAPPLTWEAITHDGSGRLALAR